MTVTAGGSAGSEVAPVEMVSITVDGVAMEVPKGTLAIRAAELLGIEIPRFCDHPLLDPVAACRACLVEIDGVPKPQPACAQTVSEGMQIRTQVTSEVAREAQAGVMEFLLLNHPLDCPVCDKGGECPLQNQAMAVGRPESRFLDEKRTFPKPINVSAQVLLDRERCVSCARCTRFAEQIAGDPMLELLERGAQQQVGTAEDQPFDSYFSGNTIQICPVGALTSAAYRFRARPFDLVSVPTVCEHCASGCSLRTDYRRETVMRRLAWDDPEVNEEWNCDKGRFAFRYQAEGRLPGPMVREDGELRAASWPEALAVAAKGLAAAGADSAVLVGGRVTKEEAYAYARFARVALGTDDIDFRARACSAEESEFLAARVAGMPIRATYNGLENAPAVLLVALEPEDESPILFLRLRKAARKRGLRIWSVGAVATNGLAKVRGALVPALPGREAEVLGSLDDAVVGALQQPGAVILVGERIATVPGGPQAVAALADRTGAALSWVPRRAGERGALDAGALAGLLPGGRPLIDASARAEVAGVWGVEAAQLPGEVGRSGDELLQAMAEGRVRGLLVGGVDPADYGDVGLAERAFGAVPFIVSLEQRHSLVTGVADVVLPIAAAAEKAGTFIDWEGRPRPFGQVLREALTMSDAAVLALLADAMGSAVGPSDLRSLRREIAELGQWAGSRAGLGAGATPSAAAGTLLASWRQLIDAGTLQEGDPHLAATARPTVAIVSARMAADLGNPASVIVTGPGGSITLPLEIGEVLDGAVWLPMRSPGCMIGRDLGARPGDALEVKAGDRA